MIKRFGEWFGLKEKLHRVNGIPMAFKDRDIWWCAFGENVGIEVNGKNRPFSRPVFVYRKLSREGFMGIPLSTVEKQGSWYVSFTFQRKQTTANIAQAGVMSAARLYTKMGSLDDGDIEKIHTAFCSLYR